MKKYAAYKQSGIEWLGEIPEHWEIKRLKDKVDVNNDSLGKDTDPEYEIEYLDISNVDSTGITGETQMMQFFEAPSRARRIVKNHDVAMSTVRPYLKAIAYLHNIPDNLIASTGFAVMTSKLQYNPKYIYYQVISHWFNSIINSKSVGASYPAVNNDVLVATKILIPPKNECIAITKYLDERVGKLNQLIKNKEDQIEKLKEIRQIKINTAVTKGLNPKAKMKKSGIDWLGDIPDDWEVKRLKNLANVVLGKMLQNNDTGSDCLKPYLRSLNVQWEKVVVEDVNEMWFSDYEMEQYRIQENDIVVSEGGEIGRAALWHNELPECYIQNSVHKISCFASMNPYFLLFQFVNAGYKGHFKKIANRVSIAHLTREKLIDVHFAKPPREEQNKISNYLKMFTGTIDNLIQNLEHQIEKLKEIHKIEIYNAVTGKIKVI